MKNLSYGKVVAISSLFIIIGILILCSQYLLNKKTALFDLVNMGNYFNQIENVPVNDPVIPDDPGEPDNPPDNPDGNQNVITENYIAVLEIPKIDLKKGLYNIDSKYNTVSRNVQILTPSDFPDVKNGNFVLAAHSGNGYLSFFKNLYKLAEGDMAYIYYNGIKYSYKISYIYKQEKTGTINVYRPHDKTTLMLITCTKNDNTKQTVYVAELVGTEVSDSAL